MKVKVESLGGLVGRMEGELSSEELTPEQLRDISDLERSKPSAVPGSGPSPRYRITVTDEQGERRLTVPEAEMPDSLSSIPAPKF